MQHIDLNGAWQLVQVGQEERILARVPGCVHTDLLAAEKIDDPFVRDNEARVQWIGEVDWAYSRTFTVPADVLEHEKVLLRCLGLDTLATVALNGVVLGQTENMFRTWEFDVKALLHAGENTIEVRFASTLPYIHLRQQERIIGSWAPAHEVAGRGWVRKEPCNFGWDWGPVLVTCGIWRPIELLAFNNARLVGVQVQQDHSTPGEAKLSMAVSVNDSGMRTPEVHVQVTVTHDGQTWSAERDVTVLTVPEAKLWWPNGMGEQPLYEVTVELLDAQWQSLDRMTKRIGLRTLHLDRHTDEWGETFQFVVNGVPYFAKGANWIPADTFAPRVTADDYARLLCAAADANMNMLRVWGGGIYEDDVFYDLCDELGITIWQDFMFACSTYPAFDDAFLANVRAEAVDNISRLAHHPCLALWCGNNELEMGLVGDEWSDGQMSWKDYARLFDQLLPEVVRTLDPQHDYWPSSPHSPHGERSEHSHPQWGDAHLWDVWHGKKPFEWYRTCAHRFASEFGFQSFPEPKTVNTYTTPADRNITSYVMEHHQRSGIGNATIISYLLDWFRLPTSFAMTLWLSQILHGMAMKYAVENWRRHQPRTMGTLYWQLNDCWPVASWASLDYYGRWKACQYMAKQFFAPLLVSGVEDPQTGAVELHITSDLREPRAGELAWTLSDVDGNTLAEGAETVEIAPHTNTLVETLELKSYLDTHGPRDLLLWLELTVDGESVSTNFISFARPKHLELATDAGISTMVTVEPDNVFHVGVSADAPALWVWLELEGADARYSDNFFHLTPGRSVLVAVTPAQPMSGKAFTEALRVRSLVDTYASEE